MTKLQRRERAELHVFLLLFFIGTAGFSGCAAHETQAVKTPTLALVEK